MVEETLGSLSSEEQAYFSSRGEAEIKPPTEEVTPPPVVLDDEDEVEVEDAAAIDAPKEHKMVPLAALTKERQTAKDIKRQMAELEKSNAIWEDRWNTLLKANEPAPVAKVEEDPMPDPNHDIFAHAAWQKRQLDKLQSRIDQRETTEAQATEAQQRETAVWSYWDQSVNEYKAEAADFTDAAKFLSDFRTQQLKAYSAVDPTFANEKAINQQIDTELRSIIVTSAQQKRNPAQAVYELAKAYGYKGKAPPAAEDAMQAMERTVQAIDQSASLSSVGGARPGGEVDAQAVANMSPSQFEAWLEKNGAAKFRKLAGG